MSKFLFIFIILLLTNQTFAETVFTYMAKEDESDHRKEYNNALLKLALDKTISTYGSYKLVPSPTMNLARAKKVAENGNIKNFFFKNSISKELLSKLGYVSFPIDRGIVGYRVFFVSPKAKEKLKQVSSIEDLKKFKVLQGIGWLDTEILRHYGFNVFEGSNYKGLFGMISKNRADIFPRGANELLSEYEAYKDTNNLFYDTSIILYYPLPRFFFTNKKNTKAIERVYKGILIAYEDGSFVELWNKYYKKSIDFVNLEQRKIFKIDNPFLEGIDKTYEKYIYTP